MKTVLAALLCGALFGAGLVVSDMINPARVLAFLDVAGAWDPSLALVMGGALLPAGLAWAWTRRLPEAACGGRFPAQPSAAIDLPLIAGAALFGIGWGLVGFCPGPAIAAIVSGSREAWIFAASMFAGIAVHGLTIGRSDRGDG